MTNRAIFRPFKNVEKIHVHHRHHHHAAKTLGCRPNTALNVLLHASSTVWSAKPLNPAPRASSKSQNWNEFPMSRWVWLGPGPGVFNHDSVRDFSPPLTDVRTLLRALFTPVSHWANSNISRAKKIEDAISHKMITGKMLWFYTGQKGEEFQNIDLSSDQLPYLSFLYYLGLFS